MLTIRPMIFVKSLYWSSNSFALRCQILNDIIARLPVNLERILIIRSFWPPVARANAAAAASSWRFSASSLYCLASFSNSASSAMSFSLSSSLVIRCHFCVIIFHPLKPRFKKPFFSRFRILIISIFWCFAANACLNHMAHARRVLSCDSFTKIFQTSFFCESVAAPKARAAASSARRWASASRDAVLSLHSLSCAFNSRIRISTCFCANLIVAVCHWFHARKYFMLPKRPIILAMTLRLWSSRKAASLALRRSRSIAPAVGT
mmetsp:Transcript_2156/g.6367  ORF Transcript_2156/g.6367 Transcript_2156/m.6367 type:complete len:263 (+) Transcript_2156:402-1190(+)